MTITRSRCALVGAVMAANAALLGSYACGGGDAPGTGTTSSASGNASGSGGGSGGSTGALDLTTSGSTGGSGSGTPGCGLNAKMCNGVCTVILNDPKNCGDCDVECASDQVCTGNACRAPSACPPGTTACGQTCVDETTDDHNCGHCGKHCPDGQGCAGSTCVPAIGAMGGGSCQGSPNLGDAGCAGDIDQTTFTWALCSCKDIVGSYPFTTDAFDSADGGAPDMPGKGGGVGANGKIETSATFDVGGALWIGSPTGLASNGDGHNVELELHSNGPVGASGSLDVGSKAFVNGDVTGTVTIAGDLDVPHGANVGPNVTYAGLNHDPVNVLPPCKKCSGSHLVDVAGIVEFGKQNNDNASIGLAADALANVVGGLRLDLPCGRFYLTNIGGPGPIAIVVHGATALFVGNNVIAAGALEVTLDPQATLDVYIAQGLAGSGDLEFGSTQVPSQTRVYFGGSSVGLTNSSILAGNFYLPKALLGFSGAKNVYGSLYVGSYAGSGALEVHYDTAILNAGDECDGGHPHDCGSCEDCGNQACIDGSCGSCTDSSQCCAPLVCQHGSCVGVPK